MKKNNLLGFIGFLSCLSLFEKSGAEIAFKEVSNIYLRSFVDDTDAIKTSEVSLKHLVKVSDGDSIASIRPPKMTDRVIREVVFNSILDKTYLVKDYLSTKQRVLNKYLFGDLRIFYGTTTDPSYCLFNVVKKTKTLIGECVLATMLAAPSKDQYEIEKKQDLITAFLTLEKEFQNLDNILTRYASVENSLLSLYTANDPLYSKNWLDFMHKYYYYGVGNDQNKNATSLEITKRIYMDFWHIFYEFTYPIYWNCVGVMTINSLSDKELTIRKKKMFSPRPYRGLPFSGVFYKNQDSLFIANMDGGKNWSDLTKETYSALLICNLLYEASYVYYFYRAAKLCAEHTQVIANLALRMRDVRIFFDCIAELDRIISSSEVLNKKYGSQLKNIRELLARNGDGTELGNLVKYIFEMPLHRKWQYFLNNTGKLLATYSLLVEHKDWLLNAMAELGELDANFSVVKLYKEAKEYNPNNCYNFVKFRSLDYNTTPVLNVEGMWHPLLDSKKAVTNDVSMNEKLRTIILTGPNAGGKSTYLTNIGICVLLGQAFGIAPAKNIDFTVFSKINSYIDVSDDIIEGNSLFKAEVRRAQEHTQMLVGLKSHEFALTLFDEPFSGTNPTEGAAAEYSILLSLARFKSSFTIVATHFPLVMLLEDNHRDKGFTNFKVFINEDSEKLNYSYKVLRGKSTQAIAIRILEEEGFDVSLLERAKDIIKNQNKYVAKFE